MNESQHTDTVRPERKRYSPPTVEKVALRPEEAVLGFCKHNSTAGPNGNNCRAVGACSTQGS